MRGNHDFEVILEWLRKELKSLTTDLYVTKDDPLRGWHQGACQILNEVVSLADSAEEIVRRK